jgi:hypothetical protein
MLKKIFTFTTLLLTGLFGFSLEAKAATTTFTYTNAYSDYYFLTSACIPINPEIEVLTVSIPDNPYSVYDLGGVRSYVALFPTSNCSGGTSSIKYFDTNDSTGTFNKTYFFDYSDVAFEAISMRILLMTNSRSAIAPSGYVNFMSTEVEFNQEAPYTVIYYNGLVEYDRKLFAVNVPQTTTPTRTGFLFDYWKDRNGEIYDYQLPPNESQLQLDLNGNQVFYLYASFSDNTAIILPSDPSLSPPSDRPIDIILFNTGFYSIEGFMLLYVLLIVAATIGLWYIKAPLLVNLIVNIIITALFMIAGYFPFYIAFIMIALFVIILIQINKGGLLNE